MNMVQIGNFPSYRRSVIGAGIVLVLSALSPLGWDPAVAFAQVVFKNAGDEHPVGRNRTGEECRLRLVQSQPGSAAYERFNLFCEGWNQPSGELSRFRAARGYTAEKLLTDSGFQRPVDRRVGDCGALEPTTLAGGATGVLRTCKRIQGGWTVLVVGAILGTRGYGLETFPTNLPLLELAVELLEGRRPADRPGIPPISAAIRRAEAIVGADGRLVGIQDVGTHATPSTG